MSRSAEQTSDPAESSRISTICDLLQGWLWETDAQHRFTYMSDSVKSLAGRSPEWHYGKTRQQLGNMGVDELSFEAFQQQLDAHLPFGPVEFQRRQDGRTVWMRTVGTPTFDTASNFSGYRGIAYEISDEIAERNARLAAEIEKSKNIEMLKATIHCFPIAISVFDGERRLAFANSAFYEILDLSPTQFPVGATADGIVMFLSRRGEYRGGNIEDLVARHISIVDSGTEHRFVRSRPNGQKIEILGMPIPGGGLVRTYMNVTDIVEQRWQYDAVVHEARLCSQLLLEAHEKIRALESTR